MYITWEQFDFGWFKDLPIQSRKSGNQGTTQKYYYVDLITAFDIETTYIKEIDQSVMYIWQWQFGPDCTVIGRDWYSLRLFIDRLELTMGDDKRLVCFVHNLSFEFQFLSGVFEFTSDDVFAIEPRKILKALLHDHIEFRCSYLQTNMSLRAFCEKMNVKNYKLKMDYKKQRFWYTELTDKEIAYCINDVRGLVEAIGKEMERDGDNLYTLPLTSTGYARRDAKKAMRQVSHNYISHQAPSLTIYELLREAFRGGNTHASRYYSGVKMEQVHSADISSAYPDAICNDLFPISRFQIRKNATLEDIEELIYIRKKAVLIRCSLCAVELKDDLIPVPYLATSKCRSIAKGVFDNGRILSADYIDETTITDIDYKILKSQYNFKLIPKTVASARYGKLPKPFIDCVLSYYQGKTDLKDKPGDSEHDAEFYALMYTKMKNLLNAQYGMMAQDPIKITIKYVNEPDYMYEPDPDADRQKILDKYNKKAFLVYQWGVWVTCRCREHLQKGIDACGDGFIYCDTDSCKYVGTVNWEEVNRPYKKRAYLNKTYATDPNGKKHFMGLFELEDDPKAGFYASEFKTMGAKKYAYRDPKGKLHITIAGVNKRIGAIELERAGGLDAMQEGFVFKWAGGLEARYNDHVNMEYITPEGVPIRITRNVSLVENTKTLGLTGEYRDLIATIRSKMLDI